MRKVSSFSIGALAVLLLTFLLLGCGGGRSAPTGSNLKSMPAGRTIDLNETLAELDALQAPAGVDPVIFNQLKDSLRGALVARGKIVCVPPADAVNDLLETDPATAPPTIVWSENFFRGDGDRGGSIGVTDVTPLAIEFGKVIADNPEAMYADYNDDGTVGVSDVTVLAMEFGKTLASFDVEWSETETGTYALAGNVPFDPALPDLNANSFKVWNYQFGAGVLPAVPSVWVRITPRDADTVVGVVSDPIEIPLNVVPPQDFYVTGIRVGVTNTVNTDAADTVNIGTTNYVAPAGGGDTFGDVASNTVILIDLTDVYYLWKNNPYGPDDPLPADLTQAELDAFIADAKAYMSYSVTPVDTVEGWTASATQPPTGYEGRIGPNDDLDPPNADGGRITATLADYEGTQGANSFTVEIVYDQTVDPNAPAIFSFDPMEQPQNVTQVSQIRAHFGADAIGDEMPFAIELHNAATGALEATFLPSTTVPVEGLAPPDNAGEYTLNRITGNPDFTTIFQVKVAASQLDQSINYVWRVSEDVAGFELKSSLKKPGDVLDIIGPDLFDMNTWPEEEFYDQDPRQPWLYFTPQNPLIRRNPLGHRDLSVPPVFEPDDAAAFTDYVKSTGEEFLVVFGETGPPPVPDSPTVYYSYGTVPPATIGAADGEIPISSRQPHLLAGIAGVVDGTPGSSIDVSFGLFSKEGTYLGGVSRIRASMQTTRSAPIQGLDGDFGVRPWGAAGDATTPDFSDNTASIGSADVVVFTFYNLWLRHDDGPGLPQDQQGTHVIFTDAISSAPLPELRMRTGILGNEFQGALCHMTLDVSQTTGIWFQNIDQQIPFGEYNVTIESPGAGNFTYPKNIFITP